jgi:membrane-bound lytic murein transglycosylase B
MGSRVLAIVAVIASAAALIAASGSSPPSGPPAALRVSAEAAPAPDARVPGNPGRLAPRLVAADAGLRRALHAGRPSEVTLYALYVQRALRMLSRHPRLADATIGRLHGRLRRETREATASLRDLRRLSAGWKPHRIRVGAAEPLSALRGDYADAQKRFGVGWHILAAVNHVESAFGRLRSASVAGAQGPMQFMPSTWSAYGLGGNVHDAQDAILGAANFLHRHGAPDNYARALYAYNPSPLYVDAVLRYARLIAGDRDALDSLYAWQVFVRTRHGERRITGPGASNSA